MPIVSRAADEDVAIAVSALRPVINFITQAQLRNVRNTGGFLSTPGEDLNGTMQISLDLTLYNSGGNQLAIGAAKETVLATREALVGVEQQVLLSAVSAYMDVRSAIEFVVLRQRNIRVIDQELQAARDRFEVGEVTRTDVALAEARLAAARSNLSAAEGDLAVAREAYKAATGAYPGTLSVPPAVPLTARSLDEAKSIALRTHPAIRQSQHQVAASELNIQRAQSSMGPTIATGIDVSIDDDRESDAVGTLTFSQPLFRGGQLKAVLRQARANAEANRAALHQTGVNVTQAVGNAWSGISVARAQTDAGLRQIEAAQIAYEGVREEAKLGARTTLDVLDAEQELLDAETTRIAAQNQQYVAVYSLLSAMGLLTADHLKLGIPTYDPAAYYNLVKNAPPLSPQGGKLDKLLQSIGRN